MKAVKSKNKKEPRYSTINVVADAKKEFTEFAKDRNRNIKDVAAASIRALKNLPEVEQNALLDGRELMASR